MKITLIISSYNQKRRLRLCLQSALVQQVGPNVTDYQIIVADDNSNDGTLDMLTGDLLAKIDVNLNPKSLDKKYTLADNWNEAAEQAKGDRLIFTNGDIIFCKGFIEAHADPIMQQHIIIGPVMRSTPEILPYINSEQYDYKQIIELLGENNWLTPDMRVGRIAHTYNKKENPWHVYGYNFSILKEHFNAVGGFPPYQQYGDEDIRFGESVVKTIGCEVRTNNNALGIHLWHPQLNSLGKTFKEDYQF